MAHFSSFESMSILALSSNRTLQETVSVSGKREVSEKRQTSMKIGENWLNEVPVEKSILVDFDQFITLVNKWKAKWVHEGYSWFQKKKKHQKGPSVGSTPSI